MKLIEFKSVTISLKWLELKMREIGRDDAIGFNDNSIK